MTACREHLRKKAEAKKLLVFQHYGMKCACCGEASDIRFLAIDHMNGGGNAHRREAGKTIYRWLIRHGFPEGFQTLCHNCNMAKAYNGNVCPHQERKHDHPRDSVHAKSARTPTAQGK